MRLLPDPERPRTGARLAPRLGQGGLEDDRQRRPDRSVELARWQAPVRWPGRRVVRDSQHARPDRVPSVLLHRCIEAGVAPRHREEEAGNAPCGSGTCSQASQRGGDTMSKKHIGSSLSSFLDEMEIREETELLAIKKTLALQLRQAMKRRSVSQSRLAKEMRTSRTVINRMLEPNDTGVTPATLTRASQVLGLRVDIRLSATRRSAA